MATKDRILELLTQKPGTFYSGEALAEALGVSRNAVWKAVKSLQAQGHEIDAVPNRGYALAADCDSLSAPRIAQLLTTKTSLTLTVQKTVTSTNALLRAAAEQGAAEGTVLLTEEQTAGRGRLNRRFYSPENGGIYMSILLRPTLPAAEALSITTAAAVAVAEAVETLSDAPAKIKWVNDIYLRDRKICGILTEAAMNLEQGTLSYAVLGIGVNVRPAKDALPPELDGIAGTVFDETSYPAGLRNTLAAEILNRFFAYYAALPERTFLGEYQRRSWLDGKDILVLRGDAKRPAHAERIDDDCRLIVTYPDGTREALSSGEVSTKLL